MMPLKLTGNVVVDAPRETVWNLLFEVETLKAIASKIPGITIERLEQIADDKYTGTATIGVAMVKGKYEIAITVIEKRASEFVKFRGEGKSGSNWASGEMGVTLAAQENKTVLTYDGVGNVGGTLATVGQRLIDTVGKHFIAHGTKSLAEELAKRSR
jgi:carbon monoxide dehydrogenase subunit G